jgi:tripartite-type tricarboxylate transporter receptor subunit TctC
MARYLSRLVATVGLLVPIAAPAPAQDFPTKPIRIIVPFAPGGINDVVGRMFAAHLTERFGRQAIVENRTGAGGVVGTDLVANSPKDGHTLLVVSIAHAVNPWLYKLNYDPAKSLAPIAPVLSSPMAVAVNPEVPAKSLAEFVALAKQQPGKIQYASGGVGGALHLAMELFKLTAGVDLLHVPFRGAAPAMIDVVGGHTKAISATVSTLAPQVRAGKLRALGTSGTKRTTILPDVPTVEEGGVTGYDAGNWIGLAAPAGTPPAIIALLNKELSAMLDNPEYQKQIAIEGAELLRMSPDAFATFMDGETVKWGRVVKQAGIKAE